MKAVDHERKSDGIREHNEEGNEAFREVVEANAEVVARLRALDMSEPV